MNGEHPKLVLVIASANPNKAKEMVEILDPLVGAVVELRRRPPEVPEVEETGATLEENAKLKARAIGQATGLGAIADDTGLEVVALGGRPGVFAARYAGPQASFDDNIALLLSELDGQEDRRARFLTVVVAALSDGPELVATGWLDGSLALAPRGRGGFGYDPVFVPDGGDGRTLAELSTEEKHRLSHRGNALRELAASLRELFEAGGSAS